MAKDCCGGSLKLSVPNPGAFIICKSSISMIAIFLSSSQVSSESFAKKYNSLYLLRSQEKLNIITTFYCHIL